MTDVPEVPKPPQPGDEDFLKRFFDYQPAPVYTETQLAQIQLAKKDGLVRRQEIGKTLTDPDDQLVQHGRQLGKSLFLGENIEWSRLELISPEMAETLKAANSFESKRVIDALENQLQLTETGQSSDIYSTPSDQQATPEEGERREAAQKMVVVVKSTLLGMAETAASNSNWEVMTFALEAAQINMHAYEPQWFTEAVATHLGKLDFTDDALRAFIIKIDEAKFGITTDMKRSVDTGQITTPQEKIWSRIHEARILEAKVAQKRAAEEKKALHAKELPEKMQELFKEAVAHGNENMTEHISKSDSWVVRVQSRRHGAQLLEGVLKTNLGHSNFRNINEKSSRQGASGLFEMYETMLSSPDVLDRIIDDQDTKIYADAAGKQRFDYEREGDLEGWRRQIRSELELEIMGNVLGGYFGVVGYEQVNYNFSEQRRTELMTKAFEIMGGGRAYNAIVGGQNPTEAQAMVRSELNAHIQAQITIANDSDRSKAQRNSAAQRVDRLKRTGDIAKQADTNFARKEADRKNREVEELRKARERITLVKQLRSTVTQSLEQLRDISALRDRYAEITRNNDGGGMMEYLQVKYIDTKDDGKVIVEVNQNARQQVENEITRLKSAQNEGTLTPEDRTALQRFEADKLFFDEIAKAVEVVNRPNYKAYKEEGRFQKIRRGQIRSAAFDHHDLEPQPTRNTEPFEFENAVKTMTDRMSKIENNTNTIDYDSLPENKLERALRENSQSFDGFRGALENLQKEIGESSAKFRPAYETHMRNLARSFVKNTLYNYLDRQGRITWQ